MSTLHPSDDEIFIDYCFLGAKFFYYCPVLCDHKSRLKKGLLTPALTEDRWLLLKTEV